MKKFLRLAIAAVLGTVQLSVATVLMHSAVHAAPATPTTNAANGQSDNPCPGGGSFLGLPKWYKYLGSTTYTDAISNTPQCQPRIDGINDIWKIVAAVLELLTRLASLIAIGMIVYGGTTYILSQGNPDKTKQSLKTVINAAVGLAITIAATALVSFIAGRF